MLLYSIALELVRSKRTYLHWVVPHIIARFTFSILHHKKVVLTQDSRNAATILTVKPTFCYWSVCGHLRF